MTRRIRYLALYFHYLLVHTVQQDAVREEVPSRQPGSKNHPKRTLCLQHPVRQDLYSVMGTSS